MEDVWRVTGRLDGPSLAPPSGVVDRIRQLGAGLPSPPGVAPGSGSGVDVVSLLGWRVGVAGFVRSGRVSAGGSCRLLRAADGWVAVNLARDDDLASVPAWLELDEPAVGSRPEASASDRGFGVWGQVEAEVARRRCAELVDRAALLGMPVSALGEVPAPTGVRLTDDPVGEAHTGGAPPIGGEVPPGGRGRTPVAAGIDPEPGAALGEVPAPTGVRLTDDSVGETHTGGAAHAGNRRPVGRPVGGQGGRSVAGVAGSAIDGGSPVRARLLGERRRRGAAGADRPPLVVDLSSLWAGPLCTRLLADRGARVVKVESATRPDGARRGPRAFFDRLHAGKELRTLDLAGAELLELLRAADVVIEASRPRALRQLGIVAEELDVPVWVSITGYGRDVDRVAFGDDAAVAGGLVAWDPSAGAAGVGAAAGTDPAAAAAPCFAGDAIADPLTGVAAAAAVVEALEAGGRWLLDVSMAAVAAWVAGDDRGAPWTPT